MNTMQRVTFKHFLKCMCDIYFLAGPSLIHSNKISGCYSYYQTYK